MPSTRKGPLSRDLGKTRVRTVPCVATHEPDRSIACARVLPDDVGVALSIEIPSARDRPHCRDLGKSGVASIPGSSVHQPDRAVSSGRVLPEHPNRASGSSSRKTISGGNGRRCVRTARTRRAGCRKARTHWTSRWCVQTHRACCGNSNYARRVGRRARCCGGRIAAGEKSDSRSDPEKNLESSGNAHQCLPDKGGFHDTGVRRARKSDGLARVQCKKTLLLTITTPSSAGWRAAEDRPKVAHSPHHVRGGGAPDTVKVQGGCPARFSRPGRAVVMEDRGPVAHNPHVRSGPAPNADEGVRGAGRA